MSKKEIAKFTFELGYENVDLFLYSHTDDFGDFEFLSEKGEKGRINIGIDRDWESVVTTLLHELLEYAKTRMGKRFESSTKLTLDHSNYWFFFNHVEFAEICAAVGPFMAKALPEIEKEFKKK